MLNAIEQGIVTNSTKQRVEELEAKLEILAGKIAFEESKNKILLTKTDIKRFLSKAIRKEPVQMIRIIVKEIILYDDRVEIYYNHIDRKRPDELEHQAFCFYSCEYEYEKHDCKYLENGVQHTFKVDVFF